MPIRCNVVNDIAIRAEGVSKLYRIGELRSSMNLSEIVTSAMVAPWRRLWPGSGRSGSERRAAPPSIDRFWALKDVSFEVKRGDVLGIIGRNGAGKSTLLKVLSRITKPTEGRALIAGRVGSLLEVGTGFHPELTGRDNIYLNGIILGMKKAEIDRQFDEIVAFAEVEAFLDTPVKRYSSGMYVRLAFAVAAHLEPEVLIVDEVLAVGDAAFQKKCLGKLGDVAKEGRTILFVSHNMNAIQRLCPRSMLLERGQLVDYDLTPNVVTRYLSGNASDTSPAHWIDMSQAVRSGTGQVYVEALCYSSRNQASGYRPYTRGPLEIRLKIRSETSRSIGSIAVTIYDKYGTKLINADTISYGETVDLHTGTNIVRLEVDGLYLNPEIYTLGWWLGDHLGNAFDYVEAALNLEVVEFASNRLGTRPRTDGSVPCDFTIATLE